MKVIYIAGPYRDKRGEWYVHRNVRAAAEAALEVWAAGGVALCPHLNMQGFGGYLPDEEWLVGGMELLRRCDAVYVVFGWRDSEGARAEVLAARDRGMPVLASVEQVEVYLREEGHDARGCRA